MLAQRVSYTFADCITLDATEQTLFVLIYIALHILEMLNLQYTVRLMHFLNDTVYVTL